MLEIEPKSNVTFIAAASIHGCQRTGSKKTDEKGREIAGTSDANCKGCHQEHIICINAGDNGSTHQQERREDRPLAVSEPCREKNHQRDCNPDPA